VHLLIAYSDIDETCYLTLIELQLPPEYGLGVTSRTLRIHPGNVGQLMILLQNVWPALSQEIDLTIYTRP
jgi:hypothetical protein